MAIRRPGFHEPGLERPEREEVEPGRQLAENKQQRYEAGRGLTYHPVETYKTLGPEADTFTYQPLDLQSGVTAGSTKRPEYLRRIPSKQLKRLLEPFAPDVVHRPETPSPELIEQLEEWHPNEYVYSGEAPDVSYRQLAGAENAEQRALISNALYQQEMQEGVNPQEAEEIFERLGAASTPSGDKWYRGVRNWEDFYREATKAAYGLGEYETQDPLVRLQQQLTRQYQEPALAEEGGFEEMLRSREQAVETAMGEQAAGMGVQGAYGGVAEESERARGALAGAAQAAYAPARWQEQQKITQQMNQLLNAISRARLGQGQAIRTAGFSV